MNPELQGQVDKLKRLVFQVNGAIELIESGCVRPYNVDPSRITPNRIEIGDFVITDRFIEPRATT